MTPETLTRYLHQQIPLSAAMQARVLMLDDEGLEISAPLAPNLNQHGTGFGGSLATLAILGGWAMVEYGLQRAGITARVVIQRSDCEYLEPAISDFSAFTRLPADEWPRFLATLHKRRRARIAIDTQVRAEGRVVVVHHGTYVAIADPSR